MAVREKLYLSAKQMVDRYPGTSEPYWAQLRYTGLGPKFIKLSLKRVVYDLEDVEAWEAARKGSRTGEVSA